MVEYLQWQSIFCIDDDVEAGSICNWDIAIRIRETRDNTSMLRLNELHDNGKRRHGPLFLPQCPSDANKISRHTAVRTRY
ncbi:hypothetical protein CA13_15680 [Planctomycetes bacterium CA13]|uniref:Uncharacterized protein n=1 Tax=Novipirellula herctigrandis TaxID=2527986 RepID=A0A5C5YYI7_9BACT|nr:hypothetical protein CA13_15680 [Planctomycetes bacterium CA13]